jgi:hypothetical protein
MVYLKKERKKNKKKNMFSANENPGEIEHFARAILLISDI